MLVKLFEKKIFKLQESLQKTYYDHSLQSFYNFYSAFYWLPVHHDKIYLGRIGAQSEGRNQRVDIWVGAHKELFVGDPRHPV